MTEEEWQTGDSSGLMIEHVKRVARLLPKVRGRKYRLVAVAMVRELLGGETMPDLGLVPVLDAVERWCDDRCTLADVEKVIGATVLPARASARPNLWQLGGALGETDSYSCLRGVARLTQSGLGPSAPGSLRPAFSLGQCRVIREVFGNPFRPVAFSPDWRTDTAASLARQMYDAREFSAMPILADALQDAGCDNDAILNHCRDTSLTHVRGCWVIDFVLGKA